MTPVGELDVPARRDHRLAAAIIAPHKVVAGQRRPRLVLPTKDQPVTEGSLTKAALVEQVADATGLTKKRTAIIVDTVFGNIAEALQQGEKVELRGFGSFRLRSREPRRGRNPQDRRPSGRAAQARPLLQARQGAEGADQPGAGTGRAAAVFRVGRRRWCGPSR